MCQMVLPLWEDIGPSLEKCTGSVIMVCLPQGDGGTKPLKGQGSSADLELLLRSGHQEDEDGEEEYFVTQGQQ